MKYFFVSVVLLVYSVFKKEFTIDFFGRTEEERGETMKRSIVALGIVSLVLVGSMLAPKSAYAYQGDPNVKGPNYTPERHAAMTKAFDALDFASWKNLMQGRGRVTQVITQSNFAKFAQMHALMLQGKTADAAKIRTELGLGLRNGSGQGMGQGLHNGTGGRWSK